MFDMKKMMEQAQQVQFKMQELQEKFKDVTVEGEAGGGMVKVVMTCEGIVKSLDIDPILMSADEKETAEDLVIAAINNATMAKESRVSAETEAMMREAGMDPNAVGGGGMPF